ncbi:hypothetical protein MPSEU_000775800 [Mayamaea pseudoterrestris]|nr:hypothetical protein MPSEU_000775800 [Mayamaea pseudoterrestris]
MTISKQLTSNSACHRSRPCQSIETVRLATVLATLVMALVPDSALAFSGVTRSTSKQACVFTALTRSAVRDAASEQYSQDSRWWKPSATTTTDVQDDSSSVDDYLRFLERRYTRLYEDEPEAAAKSFNVMDWLKQGEADHKELQDNHDAFYALGVAGLAGKEMLQTHDGHQMAPSNIAARNMEPTLPTDQTTSITDSQVSMKDKTVSRHVRSSALAAAVSVLMSRVLQQRRFLLQLQTRRAHALLVAVAKTIKTAPKTLAKQLWNLGGGKQNVIATLSVVAAVTLMALHLVVKEGLGA